MVLITRTPCPSGAVAPWGGAGMNLPTEKLWFGARCSAPFRIHDSSKLAFYMKEHISINWFSLRFDSVDGARIIHAVCRVLFFKQSCLFSWGCVHALASLEIPSADRECAQRSRNTFQALVNCRFVCSCWLALPLSIVTLEPDSVKRLCYEKCTLRRSQWPRVLRRRYAAARQLRLRVRIPRGAWMFVWRWVLCVVR